jgi:enamine deaminase RidA (YjgF/YER057c/UK114 family)
VNGLVYVSGQGPGLDFKRGKIGKDLTLEEGYQAAQRACLNSLAQLKTVAQDLDRVESIVNVIGYVNSADGFTKQPEVLDGFSKILIDAFGEPAGRPTRAAIPVSLEGWVPIEVYMVAKLKK